MMRRIELERGQRLSEEDLAREGVLEADVIEAASVIVEDVRERGDDALRELTERFDGVELEDLRVSSAEIEEAVESVDEYVRDAITAAAVSIEDYQRRTVPASWFDAREGGALVGEKVTYTVAPPALTISRYLCSLSGFLSRCIFRGKSPLI